MEVQIRRAGQQDLRRILTIERASFGVDAWDREVFRAFLPDDPDLFLVAEVNGRIQGYMITCVAGHKAELVSIASAPRMRGCGIGRAMMQSTLQTLKRQRIQTWWLMVRTGNSEAIRFYSKFGFTRARLVRCYYEDGGNALRMRLELNSAKLNGRAPTNAASG